MTALIVIIALVIVFLIFIAFMCVSYKRKTSGAFIPNINSPLIRLFTDLFTKDETFDFDDLLTDEDEPKQELKLALFYTHNENYIHQVKDIITKAYKNYKNAKGVMKVKTWEKCKYSIAEAMVSCSLVYNSFIEIVRLLGHGTFNFVFDVNLERHARKGINQIPYDSSDYCLRVIGIPMKIDVDQSELIKNTFKLYNAAMNDIEKGKYLPKILFSSHQFLSNDPKHQRFFESGEYTGPSDGTLRWSIVAKSEMFNNPHQIMEHGIIEYVTAMIRIADLAHKIGFYVGDWKIYNMGWGIGLDDQKHFVLLDYDLDTVESDSVSHSHAMSLNDIYHMFDGDTQQTMKTAIASDWYCLTKEIYSIVKVCRTMPKATPEDSHNEYEKYLNENNSKLSDMFEYILEELQNELPENDDGEKYDELLHDMKHLNDELNKYFRSKPFEYGFKFWIEGEEEEEEFEEEDDTE